MATRDLLIEQSLPVNLDAERFILGAVMTDEAAFMQVGGKITEDDREAMSFVKTELVGSFPESNMITHQLVRKDFPEPIPNDRTLVYMRKES